MKKNLLRLLIPGCLFILSCNNSSTTLDAETRTLIDSLTSRETEMVGAEIDSSCKLNHDSLVKRAIDSLMIVRVDEIKKTVETPQ